LAFAFFFFLLFFFLGAIEEVSVCLSGHGVYQDKANVGRHKPDEDICERSGDATADIFGLVGNKMVDSLVWKQLSRVWT
jgi:hypothetical protein